MKFVEYAAWSRRSRGATPSTHPVGTVRGVTFHWEGPHMGAFPHDKCAEKVRGIQGFHRDGRGWADVAYNALVCPHGYIYEGRGANTASAANGYATANATWYAVCYLGGERDPFTDDAKQGFRDAVAWLRSQGNAGPEINGHRDHKATACPGDVIYAWLKSGDAEPTTTTEDDMALTAKDLTRILRRKLTKKGDYEIRDALLKIRKIADDTAAIRALLEQRDGSGKA